MTGGVAAGKSEALAAFERLGAETISSDAIVHELLDREPMLSKLANRWGPEIVVDGRADRAAIGRRVFTDEAELSWLESEVHPLVESRIGAWLERLPDSAGVAVVEVPLLFEGELEHAFDVTVAVVASEPVRLERARSRDQVELEGRDSRQLGQEEKAARADRVIANDGTVEELESALAGLMAEIATA